MLARRFDSLIQACDDPVDVVLADRHQQRGEGVDVLVVVDIPQPAILAADIDARLGRDMCVVGECGQNVSDRATLKLLDVGRRNRMVCGGGHVLIALTMLRQRYCKPRSFDVNRAQERFAVAYAANDAAHPDPGPASSRVHVDDMTRAIALSPESSDPKYALVHVVGADSGRRWDLDAARHAFGWTPRYAFDPDGQPRNTTAV